jgi:NAD(P)-dependent dehydrogenase (short-subunit alcohol dehydrogenase family)
MNRVALVTGADRGLGLSLAQQLLADGWIVVAGQYLEWPDLDELAKRYGEKLVIIPMDVSSDESVRGAAKQAAAKVDHIDLLIANAGIIAESDPLNIRQGLNYGDMLKEYDVNALGALRVVEAFLPLMDKGEMKRLCFVSSEAGSIGACGRPDWYGYCMSKAALNMAVKILHNDLAPRGYSLRLFHPGWMRTYMHGHKNLEADLEPEEAANLAVTYFLKDEVEELKLQCWDGKEMEW